MKHWWNGNVYFCWLVCEIAHLFFHSRLTLFWGGNKNAPSSIVSIQNISPACSTTTVLLGQCFGTGLTCIGPLQIFLPCKGTLKTSTTYQGQYFQFWMLRGQHLNPYLLIWLTTLASIHMSFNSSDLSLPVFPLILPQSSTVSKDTLEIIFYLKR